MRRVLLLTAAVVVLAANAWTLIATWRNRGGPSGGTMELTARELRLVEVDWESTATSLGLRWDVVSDAPGDTPPWLDATKLGELGFDCTVPVGSPNAKEHYLSLPSALVFLVLEYEGEAWRQARRGDPEPETRLFVVDAGRDARRLRDKFADTRRYVITRGVVRLSYQERDNGNRLATPRLQGRIQSVLPSQIFVPQPYGRRLEGFRHRGRGPRTPEPPEGEPRFAVTVSWGSNYEPWVHGVRPLTPRSPERETQ